MKGSLRLISLLMKVAPFSLLAMLSDPLWILGAVAVVVLHYAMVLAAGE